MRLMNSCEGPVYIMSAYYVTKKKVTCADHPSSKRIITVCFECGWNMERERAQNFETVYMNLGKMGHKN
jgi:hypothetical protein